MKNGILILALVSAAFAATAAAGPGKSSAPMDPPPSVAGAGPRWRVGLGAQWRSLDRLSLRTSPHAGRALPGRFVEGPSSRLPKVGKEGVPGDRAYKDGFVRMDEGSGQDSSTWWWGYNSEDQISADTLRLHAEGSRTSYESGAYTDSLDREFEDENGFGPVLEAGVEWRLSSHWLAGAAFGFSWMNAEVKGEAPLLGAFQRSEYYRLSITDSYALEGVIPPSAPYSGTREGPGPLLRNTPSRHQTETPASENEAVFRSLADVSLDTDIFNFNLGPTLAYERGALHLQAGAALEVDVVSWELNATESLRVTTRSGSRELSRWHDSDSGTRVLPGLGLGGVASWRVTRSLDVSASARWRAMREFDVKAGRTEAALDTSGWSLGLTLGWSF